MTGGAPIEEQLADVPVCFFFMSSGWKHDRMVWLYDKFYERYSHMDQLVFWQERMRRVCERRLNSQTVAVVPHT